MALVLWPYSLRNIHGEFKYFSYRHKLLFYTLIEKTTRIFFKYFEFNFKKVILRVINTFPSRHLHVTS